VLALVSIDHHTRRDEYRAHGEQFTIHAGLPPVDFSILFQAGKETINEIGTAIFSPEGSPARRSFQGTAGMIRSPLKEDFTFELPYEGLYVPGIQLWNDDFTNYSNQQPQSGEMLRIYRAPVFSLEIESIPPDPVHWWGRNVATAFWISTDCTKAVLVQAVDGITDMHGRE